MKITGKSKRKLANSIVKIVNMAGIPLKRIEDALYTFALDDVTKQINKTASQLDNTKDRTKIISKLESLSEAAYLLLENKKNDIKKGRDISESVNYTSVGKPTLLCGDYVLKPINKVGDLSPKEIHKQAYEDSIRPEFNCDKFKTGDVYDFLLKNKWQLQKRIYGNNLGEFLENIDFNELNGNEKNKLSNILINKQIQDIFYWHKRASLVKTKDGKEKKVDIELINRRKIEKMKEAILLLNEYGECNLDEKEICFVEEGLDFLKSFFPRDTKLYGRGLNPHPYNVMIEHDYKRLNMQNIHKILKEISEKDVIHIDTLVRTTYKHIAEEIFDALDNSVVLNKVKFDGNLDIIGNGDDIKQYEYLKKHYPYDVKKSEHFALKPTRALGHLRYALTEYIPGLMKHKIWVQEPDELLEKYRQQTNHLLDKSINSFRILQRLEKDQELDKYNPEIKKIKDILSKKIINYNWDKLCKNLKRYVA